MTIDCMVYISSVANPKKHPRKIACLESFAQGVQHTGHGVKLEHSYKYTPSRLAVILGWATTNTGGANISLRRQIIQQQKSLGFHTMCVDASCFKYVDDNSTYLRYSLGGPFYDRSEYANNNSNNAKWIEISQRLGVSMEPDKNNIDGHILICMQRDGGFAMKTLNPLVWLDNKMQEIRRISDRPIHVRPHPSAYNLIDFKKFSETRGVQIIDPRQSKLTDNIVGSHSVVLFNSSASVAATCHGVPVFADDSSCVAWPVANKNIVDIKSPVQFERKQWMYDLATAHWSDDDGRTGRIWQKFLPYLSK